MDFKTARIFAISLFVFELWGKDWFRSVLPIFRTRSPTSVEPGTTVVFDIFGNFTYRYEQDDGGMSLPVPIQGVHHMFGKVGVCTDNMFKSIVTKLMSVLGQLSPVLCVVLPPVPRYLTGVAVTTVHTPATRERQVRTRQWSKN